ncbi:MAG: RHS repeat-associated core domain-containing protein, partial [bacterium]
ATLRPGTPAVIYYVHTDHVNTPRKVTDNAPPATNKVRWTWTADPFGSDAPAENPAGAGTFKYNLRFPGQLYDSHAGLNYNYFRDYDPAIGRYVESDPIGLKGGINSFGYVGQNPILRRDPLGLATTLELCLNPANVDACVAAGEITEAQAEAIRRAGSRIAAAIAAAKVASEACKDDDRKQHCEDLLRVDTDTCNAIARRRGPAAGAVCHASASERYAACLRGNPLPPLSTWNN